jgi:hypothetical protein
MWFDSSNYHLNAQKSIGNLIHFSNDQTIIYKRNFVIILKKFQWFKDCPIWTKFDFQTLMLDS